MLHPAVIKFLAKAGAKGGAKKGPTKKRGDADYYRRIRKMARPDTVKGRADAARDQMIYGVGVVLTKKKTP